METTQEVKHLTDLDEFYWHILVTAAEDTQSVFALRDYKHYMDTPQMKEAYAVFQDIEGDDKEYKITLADIARAFDIIAKHAGKAEALHLNMSYRGRFIKALYERDSTDIDAYDAQAIIQLAMFGDVIYG